MHNAPGRKVYYGWYVVVATILLLLVAAGVRSVPGIMLVPIMQDTGWDRSSISLAVSLGLVVFGLRSPFAGALIGRFGPRRVAVAGIILMAVSSAVSAAMREIWQMDLIWGALTAAGLLSVMGVMNFAEEVGLAFFMILFGLDYIATVPPTQVLVADNFGRKNVGLVYGWVFCAHQLGAALSSALGGAIREQFGAYGFAFSVTGVMAIVAGVVVLRIARPSQLSVAAAG